MTREEAKLWIPLLQAYSEGKIILYKGEVRGDGFWKFDSNIDVYRIKPEPKLRPWKPEEVPVSAWIKRINGSVTDAFTIVSRSSNDGVACFEISHFTPNWINADDGLKNWQHSLDNGKTWLPCGVYENE